MSDDEIGLAGPPQWSSPDRGEELRKIAERMGVTPSVPAGAGGVDRGVIRRALAYRLFSLGGRLLPQDERERLLRVLATGDPEERVPVSEVVLRSGPSIYDEIRAERERAHAKHGATSMESMPWHAHARQDILVEEVGEVAKEYNEARHCGDEHPDPAKMRTELIQVAAMATAWADVLGEILGGSE